MSKAQNTSPLVSIVLPVYNAAAYLRESVDSVLRQDYRNFELLIINDGSSDESRAIIEEYAKRDSRIIAYHQENIGLVKTLNRGIELSNGSYVARIDGDDPWLDKKLSRQMHVLVSNPDTILIGGGFEIIDEDGYYLETISVPTTHEDILRTLSLRNAFGHAGVVFKRDAALKAGGYRDNFGPTEDYDLWIRLSQMGTVANLARPVYRYRVNRGGISQQNSERQANETKAHTERIWAETMPKVLTKATLIKKGNEYLSSGTPSWYGVALKQQMLADNAQIGVKLIRYRHYVDGMRQLIEVCLTGRAGMRQVRSRLSQITLRSLSHNRR